MAATLSSSGTWSAITGLDTTAASKTKANVPTAENLNFESLKVSTGEGMIWPEFEQFVQLVADGYGIGYWHARQLIQVLARMEFSRQGVPDTMPVFP